MSDFRIYWKERDKPVAIRYVERSHDHLPHVYFACNNTVYICPCCGRVWLTVTVDRIQPLKEGEEDVTGLIVSKSYCKECGGGYITSAIGAPDLLRCCPTPLLREEFLRCCERSELTNPELEPFKENIHVPPGNEYNARWTCRHGQDPHN